MGPQIQFLKRGKYVHGRSVAPAFVESVLATSVPVPQSHGNVAYHAGSTQLVLNPEGRVVTIEIF